MSSVKQQSLHKRKTRAQELEHHESSTESLDSQLCKLHIKVLCHGELPKAYLKAYTKSLKATAALSVDEHKKIELLHDYAEQFGLPKQSKKTGKGIKWITGYQRTLLVGLCEFIDNPLQCHKGGLSKLHFCKSILKGLQFKQRVSLVKVISTLFTATNIETGIVGTYANEFEQPVYDSKGNELLRGLPHYKIRGRYQQLWGESISKTKYSDCINMLKLANFFEVTACYISNNEAQIKREELREKGASIEDIEAIPRIYSEPAYKMFTQAFFDVFKAIIESEHMQKSKALSIAKRIKNKLSLVYVTYTPFSDGFFTKKRKEYLSRLNKLRYPQGANLPTQDENLEPIYH
jgi:hypothetical protein